MKFKSYILVLFMIIVNLGFSQTQKQIIEVGDDSFSTGDYLGASIYYKQALNYDSTDINLIFKYANALRKTSNYSKAEFYYKKLYKKDGGRTLPKAVYWLATMQKYNQKYLESYKSWKTVKTLYRNSKSFENKKAKQEIKSLAYARRESKYRNNATVKNIGEGVNTEDSEFSPFVFQGKLYFTSLRSSNGNYVSENYKIKVYSAELKDSVWEMEKELDNNINLPLHHNANSCFSENGRQFYFTRCESYSDCKIMVSEYENGTWNKPKILNINTINKITTHPMICKIENKEYLFFASNREGSYGKLDIWFAEKETLTRFKKPINAGKKVNSIDNEITPFYDVKNRTLYFSSNWHKGLGGYDIFKSRGRSLNRLGLPQNLGSPINTSWNDMYYFIDTLNKINYLASNRKEKKSNNNSTCCNDIFSVKFPEPKKIEDLSKEIITLEDLNKYLPVTLYFHNDCPNPRSIDTTTNLNYLTTFDDYLNLKPKYNIEYSKGLTGYKEEIAKLDIQDFFKDYVEKGVKDLDLFTNLLFIELEKGTDVEITVKGFASPLAKTDYNVKLTGRRISSLINYLNEFDNGKFKPYLNGTATNKGKLTFVRIPFGEHRANELVSDNVNDKRNSVYSKSAGLERKIEIVSVNLANDTTEKAKYKVDKYIINKGKVKKGSLIDVEFEITNTGKIPLEFKDIKASCGCTLIEMTEIPLESNKSRTLKATINTNQFVGKQTKIITLFTNTKPFKKELVITFEVE